MKTIGLLGGMSWESSLEYYRLINEFTKREIGETHSAECIMHSFDFHIVDELQHQGKWDELTRRMVDKAKKLKNADADFILICTNTMHKMAPEIEKEAQIKVLHIATCAGHRIKHDKLNKVLLLGTKFTMEGHFYKDKLAEMGIETLVPNKEDRQIIHDVIYHELILGDLKDSSRLKYLEIIEKAIKIGAEGVVLGCTEIPLLIKQEHLNIPVYDTMTIHCEEAVKLSLQK